MAATLSQTVGASAVSRTVTDAVWKHTWSSSYVLPSEVLCHPPSDPRDKAAVALKIKERVGKLLPLTGHHVKRRTEGKKAEAPHVPLPEGQDNISSHGMEDQPSDQSGEECRLDVSWRKSHDILLCSAVLSTGLMFLMRKMCFYSSIYSLPVPNTLLCLCELCFTFQTIFPTSSW